MQTLYAVFMDIQSNSNFRKQLRSATNGKEVEDYLKTEMENRGFNRLMANRLSSEEYSSSYRKIRNQVKHHTNPLPKNPFNRFHAHYIQQPNGSQDYPDFIVFEKERILTVESKFKKTGGGFPMWNSGTPRKHGIYLFITPDDVTFFLGGDILSDRDLKNIEEYRTKATEFAEKTNAQLLSNQPYGFTVYHRFAIEQKVKHNPSATTNFFTNPKRVQLEKNVLDFIGEE